VFVGSCGTSRRMPTDVKGALLAAAVPGEPASAEAARTRTRVKMVADAYRDRMREPLSE